MLDPIAPAIVTADHGAVDPELREALAQIGRQIAASAAETRRFFEVVACAGTSGRSPRAWSR